MRYPDRLADLPARATATVNGPKPSGPAVAVALIGMVALTATVLAALRVKGRTQLIAPINPDIETAAIFVGTFAGALVVGALLMRRWSGQAQDGNSLRGLTDALGFAGLCVLTATWCARGLVEFYAFAGLSPPSFPASFAVIGRAEEGRSDTRVVRLRFGPAGREFALPATDAGFEAARPGETVTLPVQTGRSGIQRALAPARWLTPADLHGA